MSLCYEGKIPRDGYWVVNRSVIYHTRCFFLMWIAKQVGKAKNEKSKRKKNKSQCV